MKPASEVAEEIFFRPYGKYKAEVEVIARALTDFAEERVKEAFNQPDSMTMTVNQIAHLQQVARAEALEEAAKACENEKAHWAAMAGPILEGACKAIRALAVEGKT